MARYSQDLHKFSVCFYVILYVKLWQFNSAEQICIVYTTPKRQMMCLEVPVEKQIIMAAYWNFLIESKKTRVRTVCTLYGKIYKKHITIYNI